MSLNDPCMTGYKPHGQGDCGESKRVGDAPRGGHNFPFNRSARLVAARSFGRLGEREREGREVGVVCLDICGLDSGGMGASIRAGRGNITHEAGEPGEKGICWGERPAKEAAVGLENDPAWSRTREPIHREYRKSLTAQNCVGGTSTLESQVGGVPSGEVSRRRRRWEGPESARNRRAVGSLSPPAPEGSPGAGGPAPKGPKGLGVYRWLTLVALGTARNPWASPPS